MTSVLLRATNVAKAYAGVQALVSASLEVRAGEVHALVGENGAGKSTLIKILTGAVQPDGGEIALDGELLHALTPRSAKALGVVAIYQQPALFAELTVAENIALGVERTTRWGRVDWRARHQRAEALLARVGARIDPEAEAGTLGMWVFLVTEIMFFGGMFFAYTLYRTKYPAAFASASNHLDLALGAVNTVVLILSSLTMALAVYSAQVGKRQRLDGSGV